MKPIVSVIIPAYSAVELLGQAVQSALDQGLPKEDLELIVVDDGSTEDVRGALARFGDAVVYVRQGNAGAAAARNRGVAASHGEYVAFLDSDDYWLPGRLTAMLALAGASAPAFITTDFYYETRGVRAERSWFVQNDRLWFFDLPAHEQYLKALNEGFLPYMTLMPRSLFDEFGGYNAALRFGEDYDFALRCLARGVPVRTVKEPLAVYRHRRPGASSTVRSSRKALIYLQLLESHGANVPHTRLEYFRNQLAYLRLREALIARNWRGALSPAARLFARPRFCAHMLRARRAWSRTL